MMRSAFLVGIVWMFCAMAAPSAEADGMDWKLSLLPGESDWFMSTAARINENNVVVGSYARDGFEDLAPILWKDGVYVDIATTYGMPFAFLGGQALGINDHGVIAGSAYSGPEWWEPAHAMLWNQSGQAWEDLHPAGYEHSLAIDVNNSGATIGQVMDVDFYAWGYMWDADGTQRFLTPLGTDPYSQTTALNNAGYGTGQSLDTNWHDRAVVWTPEGVAINVHDLLPAGTTRSTAMDIDEDNVVSGFGVDASGEFFAWTWKVGDATVTILDASPFGDGVAAGVGAGFAAGNVGSIDWLNSVPDTEFAAIWYGGGQRFFDPLPGFGNSTFEDINEQGFAVGLAVFEGGIGIFQEGGRAIIAEPVPEAGSLFTAGAGIGCYLLLRWRRRARAATRAASGN